jgi:hypothetical protein
LKPNQKVLGAMLKNAFYRTNFPLLSLICESYRTYNLAVNKGFLERIEKFLSDIRSKILAMVCMISKISFLLYLLLFI